jgi:hypothetical protein
MSPASPEKANEEFEDGHECRLSSPFLKNGPSFVVTKKLFDECRALISVPKMFKIPHFIMRALSLLFPITGRGFVCFSLRLQTCIASAEESWFIDHSGRQKYEADRSLDNR